MPYHIQSLKPDIPFKNVHGNYYEKAGLIVRLYNDTQRSGFDAYKESSQSISKVIAYALENKYRLRACGSLWSLSKIPYVQDMHLFSRNKQDEEDLKFKVFLNDNYTEKTDTKHRYLFAQCGNTIKDLNEACYTAQRSLLTSGASNGQTIAGAIGTGVHGSSIEIGSIQDTVLGLHIIKGPAPEDSVYIEPASHPVANQAFADKIGATLVRDDALFYAALVGLGAFGYVHGVLIETDLAFKLANFIKKTDLDRAITFTQNMSVTKTGINEIGMNPDDLYYLRFFINPYKDTDNTRAEIIYRLKQRDSTDKSDTPNFLQYNKDFIITIAQVAANIAGNLIPDMIDRQLPKDGSYEIGLLKDIFGDTKNLRDQQFSCGVAVEASDAEKMLRLMVTPFKNKQQKRIPSIFHFRFVKKSKATMAFTRFNMNCIIGIDGIETKASFTYLKDISKKMIESGIPHTWHWGKINYMDADFIKTMYGKDRENWMQQRLKFLGADVAQIFSNDYLHKRGLT